MHVENCKMYGQPQTLNMVIQDSEIHCIIFQVQKKGIVCMRLTYCTTKLIVANTRERCKTSKSKQYAVKDGNMC